MQTGGDSCGYPRMELLIAYNMFMKDDAQMVWGRELCIDGLRECELY